MRPALITIDLQRYCLEVGHKDKLARVETLIENTNELIQFFHGEGLPIVRVQHVHKRDGSTSNQQMKPHWTGELLKGTLTEGTWEAESHADLLRHDTDIVITKTRASAFLRTDLEEKLRELDIDTVVVAGFSTNRCVGLTVVDAWERDFTVILAGDAILGTNLSDGEQFLDYLRKAFEVEPAGNDEIMKMVSDAGPDSPH